MSRTRATKRRQDGSLGSNESSFSRHNIIKLNKGVMWHINIEKVSITRREEHINITKQQNIT